MHEDTVALLGDCTAEIELTLSTIDGLLPSTRDQRLRQKLQDCIEDHKLLHRYACDLLVQYGGREKRANAASKSVAWLKTNARMAMRADDTTVAYLVADGCDTGVRSLSKSQNRYCMANTDALNLTRELIRCEENLSAGLRPYL